MIKRIYMVFLALVLVSGTLMAQSTNKQDKKEQQKERKAAEKAELSESYDQLLEMVKKGEFLLEVNQFADRYGQVTPVSITTNYVVVMDSIATIQLAFPGPGFGYNGLNGITVDGQVTLLEISREKEGKSFGFRLRVFGTAFGSSDLFVDVSANGSADLRYIGAYGGRFTMRGNIKSLDNYNIFKGITSY